MVLSTVDTLAVAIFVAWSAFRVAWVCTAIGAVCAASVPWTRPAPSATTTASPPTTGRPW